MRAVIACCEMREEGIATQNVFPSETSRAKAFKKIEERIVKKSLDIIVLKALKQKPLSGYDIILLIYKKFGVKLSAGTVYSLLHSLEKKGLINVNNGEIRRYTLTNEGEKKLGDINTMHNRINALNDYIF